MQFSEKEVKYLKRGKMLHINDLLGYNGLVREENLLESALAAPKFAAHYQGADIVFQAAILIEQLALNHPFVDGNKRTALIAGNTFLLINHWQVVYVDEQEENVYASSIEALIVNKDIAAFVQWLRDHVQPFGEGDDDDGTKTTTIN